MRAIIPIISTTGNVYLKFAVIFFYSFFRRTMLYLNLARAAIPEAAKAVEPA